MKDRYILVIFVLASCTLVTTRPVGKETDTTEGCQFEYCSMFEGICKNGGTCVSKGCKGECKCTKDFSGLNCEVPNTPITTATPTPQVKTPKTKTEKKDDKSREKDFSLILSLFRILSGPRPRDNDISDRQEVKNKNDAKLETKTKPDKDSIIENRNNYPSRPEAKTSKKNEKSTEMERKEQVTEIHTRKETKKTAEIKSPDISNVNLAFNDKTSSSMNNKHGKASSTMTKMYIQNTFPRTTIENNIPKGTIPIRKQTSPKMTVNKFHGSSSPNAYIDKGKVEIGTVQPLVFSGNNKNNFPKVFHAPRTEWRVTTEKITTVDHEMIPKIRKAGGITNTETKSSDISSHIANAGNKVLSSTTLSNLFLTNTVFSKSKIYISNTQNKVQNTITSDPISEVTSRPTMQPLTISSPTPAVSDITNKGQDNSMEIAKGEIDLAGKGLVKKNEDVVKKTSLDKAKTIDKPERETRSSDVKITSVKSDKKTTSPMEDPHTVSGSNKSTNLDITKRFQLSSKNNEESTHIRISNIADTYSDSKDIQSQARLKK